MKHRRFIALGLCAALLLAGCWNRREVNEVAIASAVAIDRESEKELRVTVQILMPQNAVAGQDTEDPPGTFLVTATGTTVFDAIRSVNQTVSRRPEWQHNNAIIFSEEIAREGVADLLDFFIRDHESRLDQWVMVARGRAADILVPKFQLESNQGVGLRRLNLNAAMSTAKSVRVRLHNFAVGLTEDASAPVAAAVETVVQGEAADPQVTDRRVRLRGAAAFRGDKMVGWLDEKAVRGVQWVQGKVTNSIVTVPCHRGAGAGIGVEIRGSRAQLRPKWRQDGLPSVQVLVQATGKLGDLMCPEDLSKPAALAALEKRTASAIESEIKQTFERLQGELRVDSAGIGSAIARTFPDAWKKLKPRWNEVYPKVTIVPVVTVRLDQTGTATGKPMKEKP